MVKCQKELSNARKWLLEGLVVLLTKYTRYVTCPAMRKDRLWIFFIKSTHLIVKIIIIFKNVLFFKLLDQISNVRILWFSRFNRKDLKMIISPAMLSLSGQVEVEKDFHKSMCCTIRILVIIKNFSLSWRFEINNTILCLSFNLYDNARPV